MSILVSIFTRTPKSSPTLESTAAAATKTENTHLSFPDSFRLGLHEFFFCGGGVRSFVVACLLLALMF